MKGVPIRLMNQNFSRSKILHESSKLEHFQRGLKISGGKNFGSLKSLGFQQLSYLKDFGVGEGVKIR